jgi:hypothetical protein
MNNLNEISDGIKGVSNPIGNLRIIQELLKEITCSNEKLYQYLKSNDNYFKTNYAEQYLNTGKWPDNFQIPKSSDVLKAKGSVDWSRCQIAVMFWIVVERLLRTHIFLQMERLLIDMGHLMEHLHYL